MRLFIGIEIAPAVAQIDLNRATASEADLRHTLAARYPGTIHGRDGGAVLADEYDSLPVERRWMWASA